MFSQICIYHSNKSEIGNEEEEEEEEEVKFVAIFFICVFGVFHPLRLSCDFSTMTEPKPEFYVPGISQVY